MLMTMLCAIYVIRFTKIGRIKPMYSKNEASLWISKDNYEWLIMIWWRISVLMNTITMNWGSIYWAWTKLSWVDRQAANDQHCELVQKLNSWFVCTIRDWRYHINSIVFLASVSTRWCTATLEYWDSWELQQYLRSDRFDHCRWGFEC